MKSDMYSFSLRERKNTCHSVFLPHTLSCFLCNFDPHCEPRCPTLQDQTSSYLVFLWLATTPALSWQRWSRFWPWLQVTCSHWTLAVSLFVCLVCTQSFWKASICEVRVKNHRRALRSDSCCCIFLILLKAHHYFSCTFCFPAALGFAFSKSWESSVRHSPSTNKQQMLKCLLWLILDLQYLVAFSYTSSVLQCAQRAELILFSKQNMM